MIMHVKINKIHEASFIFRLSSGLCHCTVCSLACVCDSHVQKQRSAMVSTIVRVVYVIDLAVVVHCSSTNSSFGWKIVKIEFSIQKQQHPQSYSN